MYFEKTLKRCAGPFKNERPKKVIIDCDPGADDG